MVRKTKPYKAIAAGLTALAGSFATAVADGTITGTEVGGIVLTTVIAVGAVYGISNPEV